jgi:hypothetical protein
MKPLRVLIKNTDWFLNNENYEGTVYFQTQSGNIYEAFSSQQFFQENTYSDILPEILDVSENQINEHSFWHSVFSGNPGRDKKLVKAIQTWSYTGLGQITSINPVIVDFGDFSLDTGFWTNDEKVTGEYIAWGIDRLDIILSNY